jgi:hypothetical protein
MHRSKNFHSSTSSARASNAEAERLCCLEIDHQLDFVDLWTGRYLVDKTQRRKMGRSPATQ